MSLPNIKTPNKSADIFSWSSGLKMHTITATKAKREFRRFISFARSEPIAITNHDEAVAVVISTEEYKADQARREYILRQILAESDKDLMAGRVLTTDELISSILDDENPK